MRSLIALFSQLLLPTLTQAHGYWLEISGSGRLYSEVTINVFFGEYQNNLREKGEKLAGMKNFHAFMVNPDGRQQTIMLIQTQTCWQGKFTPTMTGQYQIFGVNDSRDVQDLTAHGLGIVRPIEYLRTYYTVGKIKSSISPKPQTEVDILAVHSGNDFVLTAFSQQQPLPKAKLTVLNSQGWVKTLSTGNDGTVRFTPLGPGQYIVEAEQLDKTPGHYRGRGYEAIRVKYALTLHID